jgi:hypothetical protein
MTVGRIAVGASTALLLVVLLLSAAAAAVVESLAAPWDSLDLFSGSGDHRLHSRRFSHRRAASCR